MAKMSRLAIDEVVWEPSIYPRVKWSSDTIKRYVDARRSGAEFPPVIVEKETNVLLDGKHRLEMEKQYIEEHKESSGAWEFPVPDGTIAVESHTVPEGMTKRYYAATLSSRHGDRLSNSDAKKLALEEFEEEYSKPIDERRKLDAVTWGKQLGLSKTTMYRIVGHIINREKASRAAQAWRLSQLGWTLEEIGERFGIKKSQVGEDISGNSHLGKIGEILGDGWNEQSIAETSERLNLPLADTWAAAMAGMDDAKRLEWLGIKIQPYDVWNFSSCHDLMGDQHPGRIPGQIIAHVLYFYTQPGQLVIDPMVGSGTTLDACLLMGRKCRGYDIDARHDRIDIESASLDQGWPEKVQKASLIFWDPPYFDKMDDSKVKDGYKEGSVSKLSREKYLEFFKDRFAELYEQVKSKTTLAFLMSDWNDNDGKKPGIHLWDYSDMLQGIGWKLERHLQVPLPTQQVHPDIVNKFRESRKLARLQRWMLIARK